MWHEPAALCVAMLIGAVVLGLIDRASGREPWSDEARRRLAPPRAVVRAGDEAPLIRYGRSIRGGAHTDGAWSGGWQITHALAAWAGDTSADAKLLEQIAYNLRGENTISANGGYPSQHERHMTGAYAILRHTPRFWEQKLTAEQRHKIDLLMRAALVASAYTTADATYADGARPTALDGDTNLHRGWNPNFREGMVGGMLVATVYFGGVDAVYAILDGYDHDAFVAELERAGLTNIHETFTWARRHPDAGAPNGEQIERNIRGYRYNGERLMEPMALYRELTLFTYGARVGCGLNDGRGIEVDGVATGVIASGCDRLPNKGELGMLHEFASRDAKGPRSSITYAYDGFRPNLTHHVVLLVGGYWRPGPEAHELLRRLDVGITDLRYKLEHGYRNYSKGKGSKEVFNRDRKGWVWSFRTTLPLWEQVIRPYHQSYATARGR